MTEQRLAGGNISPVFRVGDTVRRTAGPWTPAVHELLDHLHEHGFEAAPRPLGTDERGREILTYLDGETVGDDEPFPAWAWSDETLVETVRLQRRYHDVVRGFRPAEPRTWRYGTRPLHPSQVICHNDWAPYNLVRRDGHITGVIDWDIAGPGLAASDLAFTAWTTVPLGTPEQAELIGAPAGEAELLRRLRLLCDEYGLADRSRFVARVLARARSSLSGIRSQAALGVPGFVHLVEAGHLARMERDARFIAEHAADWQARL